MERIAGLLVKAAQRRANKAETGQVQANVQQTEILLSIVDTFEAAFQTEEEMRVQRRLAEELHAEVRKRRELPEPLQQAMGALWRARALREGLDAKRLPVLCTECSVASDEDTIHGARGREAFAAWRCRDRAEEAVAEQDAEICARLTRWKGEPHGLSADSSELLRSLASQAAGWLLERLSQADAASESAAADRVWVETREIFTRFLRYRLLLDRGRASGEESDVERVERAVDSVMRRLLSESEGRASGESVVERARLDVDSVMRRLFLETEAADGAGQDVAQLVPQTDAPQLLRRLLQLTASASGVDSVARELLRSGLVDRPRPSPFFGWGDDHWHEDAREFSELHHAHWRHLHELRAGARVLLRVHDFFEPHWALHPSELQSRRALRRPSRWARREVGRHQRHGFLVLRRFDTTFADLERRCLAKGLPCREVPSRTGTAVFPLVPVAEALPVWFQGLLDRLRRRMAQRVQQGLEARRQRQAPTLLAEMDKRYWHLCSTLCQLRAEACAADLVVSLAPPRLAPPHEVCQLVGAFVGRA